jgi:hypothetical protein
MTKNQRMFIDFANHHWADCGSDTQIRPVSQHIVQLRCVTCHSMIEATTKTAREAENLFIAVIENYLALDATVQ